MRSVVARRCLFALAFASTLLISLALAPQMFAQGGEPEYFAIRGARVVPVSGPPMESATVVMAHGVITAIGKDVAIPPDAWVVEGKGLTVYPGLFDSFTDVGIPSAAAAPGGAGDGGPRRPQPQEVSRGPEDRPGTTPWRSAADEVSLTDKRIESWRSAGFTTVAQLTFWGNYLPRVYPVHLRGTGEGFAANVGGRMCGMSGAFITTHLAALMPGALPAVKLSYAAAVVGIAVYAFALVLTFWLPEPPEKLPE